MKITLLICWAFLVSSFFFSANIVNGEEIMFFNMKNLGATERPYTIIRTLPSSNATNSTQVIILARSLSIKMLRDAPELTISDALVCQTEITRSSNTNSNPIILQTRASVKELVQTLDTRTKFVIGGKISVLNTDAKAKQFLQDLEK